MRILGIDPGTAITGYGIIDTAGQQLKIVDYGCIRTPAKQRLSARLAAIYQNINKLISNYQPDCLAVEQLFFNKNTKTALAVGHARGVVLLAGETHQLKIEEYTPLQVKQSVVGYGSAEKMQVQMMVRMLLGLREIPKPDDVADALAIAVCHAHSYKLRNIYGE